MSDTTLREALLQLARAHAWLAFGECRAYDDIAPNEGPILSSAEADALARAALRSHPAPAEPVEFMESNHGHAVVITTSGSSEEYREKLAQAVEQNHVLSHGIRAAVACCLRTPAPIAAPVALTAEVLDAFGEAIDGFEEHVQFARGSLMHVTVQKWKRLLAAARPEGAA